MNKIKKYSNIFILIATIAVATILISSKPGIKTVNASDCDMYEGDARKECEDKLKELEKKAKVYEDLIKLKNKQQDTLSAQMEIIDKEQEKTRLALMTTKQKVDELADKIVVLEDAIQEGEKNIALQKKILTGLLESYYEYDRQGVLDIVLLNENFSDILTQTDYLEQSGVKATETLSEIQKSRRDLIKNLDDLKNKKEEIENLKEDLTDKNYSLQSSENQKQSLLVQTQGEEAKYKQLLARIEEQKKELFNFSEASNLGEISASVGSYPKPSSNLASTSWYFSQKDSRWANTKIGNSTSLMKDYGCAVSCVAMVFRKNGSSTDPGKMAKQKMFYYDLIKWPGSWDPGITLASSIRHGNVSWSKIDSEISNGHPAIVYIKKTNGRGGHYVVIVGKDSKDYIVHDPYFGPNLYLGTSKSLVGKIGTDSKVVVDQMIVYN